MSTAYPAAIDSFTNPSGSQALGASTIPHASQHGNINDAMLAVQAELGTLPKGSYPSVRARLDAITGATLIYGLRNKIINGCFRRWDYATSQTLSGYGSANRWECGNIGSTKTASRQSFTVGQTDVPGEPAYFMRNAVTSSAGASNYCKMQQAMESVRTFAGRSVTLSFYAKADAACNMAVEFVQDFGSGGSPSAYVTAIGSQLVALTTSWAKKEITVAIPSISGKTLGTIEDGYLQLVMWFDAGSSLNTRTASLGQQSRTIDIAKVQVEEGSTATEFEDIPLALLTTQCERYLRSRVCRYQKLNTTSGDLVGTVDLTGMRAVPASLTFHDLAGNAGKTTTWDIAGSSTHNVSLSGSVAYEYFGGSLMAFAYVSSSTAAGIGFVCTAGAEL